MKIAIACDHRGFTVKERLKVWLQEQGHEVVDFGTHSDAACDYPDMALAAAKSLCRGKVDRAILICGTGIGMSITANKVPGVRAALVHDTVSAELSRRHNDANCLCLPGDMLTDGMAIQLVEVWLDTPFDGGRHERRLKKIAEYEQQVLQGYACDEHIPPQGTDGSADTMGLDKKTQQTGAN